MTIEHSPRLCGQQMTNNLPSVAEPAAEPPALVDMAEVAEKNRAAEKARRLDEEWERIQLNPRMADLAQLFIAKGQRTGGQTCTLCRETLRNLKEGLGTRC